MSQETQIAKTGHLAWCALVALKLAKEDGLVGSVSQENLFLTRWLTTALKQRRFCREVAADLEWLVGQGKKLGIQAKLVNKLEYLWQSCNGELTKQSDLFRLTYGLDAARDSGWQYRVLSDREWSGRYAVVLSAGVNGIYLSRSALDRAFDGDGEQCAPLRGRITGNVGAFLDLLAQYGWHAVPEGESALLYQYTLTARQSETVR